VAHAVFRARRRSAWPSTAVFFRRAFDMEGRHPRPAVLSIVIAIGLLGVAGCELPQAPDLTTSFGDPMPFRVAGGLRFSALTSGSYHTCGVAVEDGVYCWGGNDRGQTGRAGGTPIPWRIAGSESLVDVSGGFQHTCALSREGDAYCWGGNTQGEVATPGTNPSATPGSVPFVYVGAGQWFNCALTTQGSAYCWGENRSGQLGIGVSDSGEHPSPVPVVGGLRFQVLDVGSSQVCGATESEVYCWGQYFGPTPRLIATLALTALSVGGAQACGIARNQRVHCWGYGYRGDGSKPPLLDVGPPGPVQVFFFGSARAIASGWRHACLLDADGVVYCWGENGTRTRINSYGHEDGRLGSDRAPNCDQYTHSNSFGGGSTTTYTQCQTRPTQVFGDVRFQNIVAGSLHTCGLSLGGQAYCWGARVLLGR
jgi:alpha-tubulin suppressor-like RCC1 family protein